MRNAAAAFTLGVAMQYFSLQILEIRSYSKKCAIEDVHSDTKFSEKNMFICAIFHAFRSENCGFAIEFFTVLYFIANGCGNRGH